MNQVHAIVDLCAFPGRSDDRSYPYWLYGQLQKAGIRLAPLVNPFNIFTSAEDVDSCIMQPWDSWYDFEGRLHVVQGALDG